MVVEIMGCNIEFEAIVEIEKNVAYASSSLFNALCKVNLYTGECEYIDMFPDEEITKKRLHSKAIKKDNKIYFVPAAAKYLSIYDLSTKSFEMVEIKAVDKERFPFFRDEFKFADGVIWKQCIYMFSATYPAIVRVDTASGETMYFSEWIPDMDFFFRSGIVTEEGKYFTPSVKNNLVLEFDFTRNIATKHYIGKKNNGSWGICEFDKNIWLSPKEDGAIIKWNYETNEIKEYDSFPKELKKCGFLFNKIFQNQGNIFLVPTKTNMVVKVSCDTETIESSDIIEMQDEDVLAFLFELNEDYYFKKIGNCEQEKKCIKYLKLNTVTLAVELVQFMLIEGKAIYEKDFFARYNASQGKETIYESGCIGLKELIMNVEKI